MLGVVGFIEKGLICWTQLEIFSSKYIHMLKQLNNCVRYKDFKKKNQLDISNF